MCKQFTNCRKIYKIFSQYKISKGHLGGQHTSKGRLRTMRRGYRLHSDGESCWIQRTLSRLPSFPGVLVATFSGASEGRSEQLESHPVSKSAGFPLPVHQLEKSPSHPIPPTLLTKATKVLAGNGHGHEVDHFKEHDDVLVRRALKDPLEVVIEEQ